MADVEKAVGAQPPLTTTNGPIEVEPKLAVSDDGKSSQEADDKPKKEKEGSLKDYFVSNRTAHDIATN